MRLGILYATMPKPLIDDPEWLRFVGRIKLHYIIERIQVVIASFANVMDEVGEAFKRMNKSFARLVQILSEGKN